jgi:hypothetical protein
MAIQRFFALVKFVADNLREGWPDFGVAAEGLSWIPAESGEQANRTMRLSIAIPQKRPKNLKDFFINKLFEY